MKIILLTILSAVGTYCQIVFPDEYESTNNFNSQNSNRRRPSYATFPPFPSFGPPNYASIAGVPGFQQGKSAGSPISSSRHQNRGFLPGSYPQQTIEPPSYTTIPSVQQGLGSGMNAPRNGPNRLPSPSSDPAHPKSAEEIYWANHVSNIIVRGVTKFALDINRAIQLNQRESSVGQDRDNVVFSPISLVGTLAMVLLGSAGKTFEEVSHILGFTSGVDISGHSEIVHQILGSLLDSIDPKLRNTGSGPHASFADGIFVQAGYPIRPEFMAISRAAYNNEVINVDFMRQSDSAQRIINNWVDMRTHGKIQNILAQPPSYDTKIIFASALYFNGEWNRHFITSGTRRRAFKLASGQSVDVDMMYNSGMFPFYEDQQLGAKIIGLPYKNGDGSAEELSDFSLYESVMYIVLPTSDDGAALNTLESRLNPDIIEQLIQKMENKQCIVGLPKMKLSSTLNLNRALQSLGLTSLFLPNEANLALLSAGPNPVVPNTRASDSFIFSRMNDDEATEPTDAGKLNFTGRNNYFRYEDKQGGYKVQQWNNGVLVEKIDKSDRRKREAEVDDDTFRERRQSRPIDNDFVRFVEKQGYPHYGLDALRNNPHLGNPGLYASDVIHKVEMNITETGTVGAAATSVIIQRDGNSKVLVAGRPFMFFIRHGPSRLLLFWGSISKPTPNYA